VNIFEGVDFNTIQLILPLIILLLTMVLTVLVYRLLFSWLPSKIYNFFIGPAALLGAYIWAIPMNLGFHKFF
jgi:hypothetical protein